MFSPLYAAARRRMPACAPRQHCALNVAIHGRRGRTWAFTEMRGPVAASARHLPLGRSHVCVDDNGALRLDVVAQSAPFGRPVRGHVVVHPAAPGAHPARRLHPLRPHRWWPVAPVAHVEADFTHPAMRLRGRGYHDVNWGHEPLAHGFDRWDWQRLAGPHGTTVHYAGRRDDGVNFAEASTFGADGGHLPVPLGDPVALPRSRWGLGRRAFGGVREARRLEDTPFYARAQLADAGGGWGIHEALDLARFERRWVQALLHFRMRRGP